MPETYRVEIRFDLDAEPDNIKQAADHIASIVAGATEATNAEVTAIFDENWEEL